jgi:hypothetical protein
MKLNDTQNGSVVLPERAKPKRCSLAATPEAFKILSDGLYGHKIRAVVRETSTNALDGNIAMKLKNPGYEGPAFNVHLPSSLEPYYEVRDFGVGLGFCVVDGEELETDLSNLKFGPALYSDCENYIEEQDSSYGLTIIDEVTEMYTTYFHSNKIQSNDFIGCKGLGAKSPFAVCKAFTVTSIFNGEKRHYSAYLDGFPACVPMADDDGNVIVEKTDEHPGLIVRVPVKESQITQYHSEAKRLYPYFKVKPCITYPSEFTIPEVETSFEGSSWKLRSGGYTANAIMGSIAYPITEYEGATDKAIQVIQAGIDVYFDLGDLEIQPSREGLSYESSTVNTLNKKLEIVADEIIAVVGQEFDACECLWDAKIKAHQHLFGAEGALKKLANIVDVKSITWRGNKIGSDEINMEGSFTEIMKFAFGRKKRNGSQKTKVVKKHDNVKVIKVHPNATFYEIDLPKGAYSRFQYQVKEFGAEPIYAMRFISAKAKAVFAEELGIPVSRIKLASSLPEVPRNSSLGGRYSNSSQVFLHNGSHYNRRLYESWDSVDIDLNEGGIYVPMCRYKVSHEGENIRPDYIKRIVDNLEEIGAGRIKVYGVRSQLVKKFEKSDDWVDLWTFVKNLMYIKSTKMDINRHLANIIQLDCFRQETGFRQMLNASLNYCNLDFGNGHFSEFINDFQTMRRSYDYLDKISEYRSLMRIAGIELDEQADFNLSKRFKELLEIYPMLKCHVEYQGTSFGVRKEYKEQFADYVNLIDEKLEIEKMTNNMVDN